MVAGSRAAGQRLSRVCGLSDLQVHRVRRDEHGKRHEEQRWVAPQLRWVRIRGHLGLADHPGAGGADPRRARGRGRTARHHVRRRRPPGPPRDRLRFGLHGGGGAGDARPAHHAVDAVEPAPVAVAESVRLGRTQGGGDWRLQLRGRHTLVAGCSGSGKGSVLWGICCGLAPAVRADVVRLWGIDLKRGVELAMGEGLFSTRAYTPADALDVLKALMRVIDERGRPMAGTTRLHEPMVGDPLHVLVIDELAALTAYADLDVRREAGRLLAEILTQGRALGRRGGGVCAGPPQGRGRDARPVHPDRRAAAPLGRGDRDGPRRRHDPHRPRPPDQPHPSRHRRGWSRTPAPPTGSAPTTGPTP